MNRVQELMEVRRWCYWLDRCHPEAAFKDRFRVSIVIEDEPGHYPTGQGTLQVPWYWDEQTCRQKNLDKGLDENDVIEITSSSMFPKEVT